MPVETEQAISPASCRCAAPRPVRLPSPLVSRCGRRKHVGAGQMQCRAKTTMREHAAPRLNVVLGRRQGSREIRMVWLIGPGGAGKSTAGSPARTAPGASLGTGARRGQQVAGLPQVRGSRLAPGPPGKGRGHAPGSPAPQDHFPGPVGRRGRQRVPFLLAPNRVADRPKSNLHLEIHESS